MKVAFQKWGNSLALRVPKVVAQEIGASDGKTAEMSVRDGKLVIEVTKPKRRKRRLSQASRPITVTKKLIGGHQLATKSGDYYRSQPDRRPRTERPSSGIGADIE